jgi:two-component system response regulator (stage 0 sporulation protein F)
MKRSLDVLVVDDDAGIRDMLRLALAEAGHRVIAWDGTGAPPDSTVPDVVLLDVRLGNRTAADVVREFDVLARSVIVVMTASMQPEVAVRGLRSILTCWRRRSRRPHDRTSRRRRPRRGRAPLLLRAAAA